jgi:hypothetical protein
MLASLGRPVHARSLRIGRCARRRLWTELYDAVTSGDHDARSALIVTWHPMVATIEALIPLLVGPLDGWNFEAAARGLVNAIERYRQECIADRELTAPLDLV